MRRRYSDTNGDWHSAEPDADGNVHSYADGNTDGNRDTELHTVCARVR